jgi:hypothetical protein
MEKSMALINTTYGEMEESRLRKNVETIENEEKIQTATEYWLNDECVHRSVNLHLKKGLDLGIEPNSFA